MIDIFTVKTGDRVEYQNYLCSESQQDKRYYGVYQGYIFWSPDERPVELWVNLIGQNQNDAGCKIFVRASQVTNVSPVS